MVVTAAVRLPVTLVLLGLCFLAGEESGRSTISCLRVARSSFAEGSFLIGVEGERSYDGVKVPAGFLTGEERVRSTTSCSGVAGSSFVMGSCWNVDVLTSMDGIDVVVPSAVSSCYLLAAFK